MTAATFSLAPLLTGQTVHGYTVGTCVGEGGFGAVFQASRGGSATVAIKFVTHPSHVPEFEREIRYLEKASKSSGVSSIEGHGVHTLQVSTAIPGHMVEVHYRYAVLELAAGNLRTFIYQNPHISWMKRLKLWRSAVKGVHQLHLRSIAHRDLKSENLLLSLGRTPRECIVADLGRARDWSEPAMPGRDYSRGRGDFRFAPPELLWAQGGEAPLDFVAGDLYGLGSLLFELTLGSALTQSALGNGPEVLRDAQRLLAAGATYDLSALRAQYESSFQSFEDLVPVVIRHRLSQLMRQLCDPDPSRRFPRRLPGRGLPAPEAGLEWLLRQVDIATRTLIHIRRGQREAPAS